MFNWQGTHGKAVVWAEVSDKFGADQFVYLVAQDMRTGRVFTIEDNRCARHTHNKSLVFVARLNNLVYRSEEHTSELQSLLRLSYAVFCLNKKKQYAKSYSILS